MKIQQVFQEIKNKLPSLKDSEIEFVLKSLLKKNKTQLYLSLDENINQIEQKKFFAFINRHQKGEPVGYILGELDFFQKTFSVKKPILIPRVDSEVLVIECLKLIQMYSLKKILEIGSGSGILSLSIAMTIKLNITAIDISSDAVFLGKKNLKKHKKTLAEIGSQMNFKKADIFNKQTPKNTYEMIFSNPPYISDAEMKNLPSEIKDWEDRLALWGGEDGLKFYRYFAKELKKWLVPKGWLVLEQGASQQKEINAIFKKQGWIFHSNHQDFSGRDRVCVFQNSSRLLN